MEKRNIGLAIVFTMITCGIYGLYWLYKMTEEVHCLVGRRTTASGGMVILYTLLSCGIYSFYWMYKMGETMTEAKMMRGMHADQNSALLYIVLAIFALGIVSEALIQSSINDVIAFDERNYYNQNLPQQMNQNVQ